MGRNTSILRDSKGLKLAPIYDLAPMVMDDEGITRTTKWPQSIEVAGEVNWRQACAALAQWTNTDVLYERLRDAANNFLALPDLLSDQGLPSSTMNHPRIALRNLQQRLSRWELV
jgi:serine/threonine-protein kinase HipA